MQQRGVLKRRRGDSFQLTRNNMPCWKEGEGVSPEKDCFRMDSLGLPLIAADAGGAASTGSASGAAGTVGADDTGAATS